MHAADLCDLLVVFIKWLAVFPVEESGDAHNFFLLVDDGQRQDVLDDEARLIHGLFLKGNEIKHSSHAKLCDIKSAHCTGRAIMCVSVSRPILMRILSCAALWIPRWPRTPACVLYVDGQ